MKITLTYFIVKVLDYISTKLNFSLTGYEVEANPLFKHFFSQNNDIGVVSMILLTVILFAWAERRYKNQRSILRTMKVMTFITIIVVVNNFYCYFVGLSYL